MPYKELAKRRAHWKGWYSNARNRKEHILRATDHNRQRRLAYQQWANDLKAKAGCKLCPEADPICLDYHHRNPKTKRFSITDGVRTRSKPEILKEIKKCDVLCANCHRKTEYKNRQKGGG